MASQTNENRVSKIALLGLMIAVAFVLSWLEVQVSFVLPVPGMKLGLTNLAVIIALYMLGWKEAFFINMVRILLVSVTFGSMFSLIYSLAGGILSTVVMILLKRYTRLSITVISAFGGVTHNIGQIITAMILLETKQIGYYFAVLWLTGVITGTVIGILGGEVVKHIPKQYFLKKSLTKPKR